MGRIALAALLAPWLACAQAGEGTIAGRVVEKTSGEPVPRALVLLVKTTKPMKAVSRASLMSDENGAFHFDGLQMGDYLLVAGKPGFEQDPERAYLQTTIGSGMSGPDLTIRLQAQGAIEGTVRNDKGQPMPSVVVQLVDERYHFGSREFTLRDRAVTDDRGRYRFGDLSPWSYFVRAAGYDPFSDSGESVGYRGDRAPVAPGEEVFVPVYNGGSRTLAIANPVAVAAGKEATVDLTVSLAPEWHTIRGAIANAQFVEQGRYELTVDGEFATNGRRLALDKEKGLFEVRYCTPGIHRIRLIKGDGPQMLVGEATVTVKDADIEGVVVQLLPMVTLKGTVRSDDGSKLAMPQASLERMENNRPTFSFQFQTDFEIKPGPKGNFQISNLPPGDYYLRAETSDAYIDSAFAGDADLLHGRPLQVRGEADPASVEITLKNDGGIVEGPIEIKDLPPTAFVTMLPESGESVQVLGIMTNGRFKFTGVKPGEYTACVFPHGIPWQDPDVRRALHGVRVRVEAKGHQEIALKELAQ